MIVTTDATQGDEFEVPVHPDGGEFTYVVFDNDGSGTFADSLVELLGEQIPGYKSIAESITAEADSHAIDQALDDLLGLRYDDLLVYANALQRWMVSNSTERDLIDLQSIGDEAVSALMNERFVPFEGVTAADGTVDLNWQHSTPLVLFVTDYAPYTDRALPEGNIIWVDPSTELTYMQSLDTMGVVDFYVLSENAEEEVVV